jgi:hypothetical protein
MYIFLDFDGVLHPEASFSANDFEHVPRLWESIKPFTGENQIKIVLSTAWRESWTFEELKRLFPEEIRAHIIDVTPIFQNNWSRGARQREIEEWLRVNGAFHTPWIALDDREHLFEESGCENLMLINPETGLTDIDLTNLQIRLKEGLARMNIKKPLAP